LRISKTDKKIKMYQIFKLVVKQPCKRQLNYMGPSIPSALAYVQPCRCGLVSCEDSVELLR
jgi:hypothetical protein